MKKRIIFLLLIVLSSFVFAASETNINFKIEPYSDSTDYVPVRSVIDGYECFFVIIAILILFFILRYFKVFGKFKFLKFKKRKSHRSVYPKTRNVGVKKVKFKRKR